MNNKQAKKKKTNLPRTVTIAEQRKQGKIEFIVVNIICLFVFLAFGYIAVMSFFQTSVIDKAQFVNEHIIFEPDNLLLNILFTSLFIALVFWLRRFYRFFSHINMRVMEIALAVWTVVLGLIWVLSVTSVPAADSQNIFEAATKAAHNDYTPLFNNTEFYMSKFYNGHSYYNYYPYQLGFVLFSEIIYRIFGTDNSIPLQILNILSIGSAYFALARITKLLFKRKSVEFIAIILLAGCLQPILFCTFVYGNIIGMSIAIWASLFLIKYFQTGSFAWIFPSGALLTLSVIVKYNNLIYLVAFAVMLLMHAITAKKWQSIAFTLAICISCVGVTPFITSLYETRANTTLESGVSQKMYLDLGLQESSMAPGWYTRTAVDDYIQGKYDTELANKIADQHISKRLEAFSSDFGYAFDFFSKKVLSQWNEPSYESIWISQVKGHSVEINGLAKGIYEGSTGQFLQLHFNFYMEIILLLFATGIYMLFLHRKTNTETVLLPLVILGAFGYHVLFEAKSQYAVTYIPLLLPTAAYAFNTILFANYMTVKKILTIINKKK